MAISLTPRELDIITAILNGNTATKDLAQILAIRQNTVNNHLKKIRGKTGVRRAGLPRWAKQNLGGGYVEEN